MNKFLKIALIVVGVIVLLAGGGLIYLFTAFPKVGNPPDLKVVSSPEMIERGRYLANHVSVCIDCHSTRDFSLYSGPIKPGTFGKGGDKFDKETAGIPGTIYAPNITPTSLGNWTDGEIYRTITSGVNKDGEALFPIMPYPSYSKMDPEDVKAIIAYIRTLHPLEGTYPRHDLNFPLNIIVRTIPGEPNPMKAPAKSDVIYYGKYMTTIAGCGDCHTPAEKGTPIEGMEFAGGFEFKAGPVGTIRSANITPDNETGIGMWTEDMFVARFKNFLSPENAARKWMPGTPQTVMPWTMYAGMEDYDLRAIYKYLKTLKPVKNPVVKFSPPSAGI
jgi:mono/diheme cytochrome c family protein